MPWPRGQASHKGWKMLPYRVIAIFYILVLFDSAFAQNYAVFIQESPAGAGEIKPGAGVHTYGIRDNVTLTTAPNPGYHFVGWLGDVRDPTASRTSVTIDGPKIIIAVFERDEYEMLAEAGAQVSEGTAALYPHNVTYTSNGGSWSPPQDPPHFPPDNPPDNPPDDPPPVPQVPEPATILFLGIGIGLLTLKRKTINER